MEPSEPQSPTAPITPAQDADAMFGTVYESLKSMAHRELGRAAGRSTINTTELVHELYMKLCTGREPSFGEPAQFFAYAARAMRHILVDRARHRLRLKAGGDQVRLSLTDPAFNAIDLGPEQALQLDAALDALALEDARAAQTVELHYFGGLGLQRVAEVLGVARRTVDRDWRYARAFLLAHIN
jgi:RNA polymerase sigma factor (TIGR02999 family)